MVPFKTASVGLNLNISGCRQKQIDGSLSYPYIQCSLAASQILQVCSFFKVCPILQPGKEKQQQNPALSALCSLSWVQREEGPWSSSSPGVTDVVPGRATQRCFYISPERSNEISTPHPISSPSRTKGWKPAHENPNKTRILLGSFTL